MPTRPTLGAAMAAVAWLLSVAPLAEAAPTGTLPARAAPADAVALVLRGHGLGHGIGLSQWGARERAAAGQSYRQILSFYYPRTHLGRTAAETVRVLLWSGRTAVRVGAAGPFELRDAAGRDLRLTAGLYRASGSGRLGGRPVALPATLSSAAPVRVAGTRYRGSLTLVRGRAGVLEVVDRVPLETYVADVVSSECPGYWPQQALRAQAVASRTYTLAHLRPGAPFDVYPDDRSQRYHGLLREYASAAAAARATAGEVLRYRGRPIDALYSAANGGLTDGADGLWGGRSVPYLPVRRDPFDARSPETDWGPVRLSTAAVRARLPELPAHVSAVSVRRNAGDRAIALTFVGSGGTSVTVPAYRFQQRLGLRSTFFAATPVYG